MQVDRSDKEIIVRIPIGLDSEKLQSVLDLIRYGELTSKSTVAQEEVDQLASDINKSWWLKNRDRFIK
ncbi:MULTISPECIES: hypothetical protein [unclassified Imperialibacter]|uniref:hypothetical protein n=1 Tax=unclassified Imperialibacter TaxID=2629706 RepID=UPI001251E575|nr:MULTISPECIES: hypothetical protein [unclassified Imperialibacter]CAD5283794.1 conserved hypothetical protein [Imperialibacter sp. 89]CAD5285756.1 conserved hypothetical protein [Imperialibacter sp. 75]VVT29528.1 conserved hypothetical protein [Imperialibacter sp. EC-SDR9]